MIEHVDHIGIAVRSIEEAKGMWEALGLEVTSIEEVPSEGVRVAFIPCGQTSIELLEPLSPDTVVGRFLDKNGPGIHHVCLKSSDVVEDDGKLRQSGYRVLRDAPSAGAGGTRVQFVHPKSAGGVLLELAEGGHS